MLPFPLLFNLYTPYLTSTVSVTPPPPPYKKKKETQKTVFAEFYNVSSYFFHQEAPVLGTVGFVSGPLPLYSFFDNRDRKQSKCHSCATTLFKPPFHSLQLLPTVHTAPGADEEQQVT